MIKYCKNCVHYFPMNMELLKDIYEQIDPYGHCMRYPPIVIDKYGKAVFPEVIEEAFCGEHASKVRIP